MDSFEIHSLFSNQQHLKKYLKKDLVRVYDPAVVNGTNRLKFTCHGLTTKLMNYSEGFLLVTGYIHSTDAGNALANNDIVSIQNGSNSLFIDAKLSFNNNQVEHNIRPDISTTWVNLLEYSPDYASSIAVQWAFVKDAALDGPDNDAVATLRAAIGGANLATVTAAGGGRPARFECRFMIPLAYLFQFVRRLSFPLINQLVEIELTLNETGCIFRNGAHPSAFVMTDAQMLIPEVVLPTPDNTKLMKSLASNNFTKTLEWDSMEYQRTNRPVAANVPFNELIDANLTGIRKIYFLVHANFNSQEHVQTGSAIAIRDFNVEINSRDLYNMNIATDQEAYRLLSDNFNSQGQDVNTGSLLPYTEWILRYRVYVLDLNRQEEFESDPNAAQSIRIRGTPNAAGRLVIILAKNRVTRIDMANPQNTKTI